MTTQETKDQVFAKVEQAAANAPSKLASMQRWAICGLGEKTPWTVQDGKLRKGGHTLEENLLTLADAVERIGLIIDEKKEPADGTEFQLDIGLNYIFFPQDPFKFIDFDHIFDIETKEPKTETSWMNEWIQKLDSYSEHSMNDGAHVVVEAPSVKLKGCKYKDEFGEVIAELYPMNGARPMRFTGDLIGGELRDVEPRQELFNELVHDLISRGPKKNRATKSTLLSSTVPVSIDRYRAIERAEKYAIATPGAVSGSGGSDAAYYLAQELIWGFALEDHEAKHILLGWNNTCQPPWSEKEIDHKISQALKNPRDKPRGYRLQKSTSLIHSTTSNEIIDGITKDYESKNVNVSTTPKKKIELIELGESDFPTELIDTAIGQHKTITEHCMQRAFKPLPANSLGAAVALSGLIGARKVVHNDATPNVYCFNLAGSGYGKSAPRKGIRGIISKIGGNAAEELLGPEKFYSESAFATVLESQSACIFMVDEAGKFFKAMSSPVNQASSWSVDEGLLRMWEHGTERDIFYSAKADGNKKHLVFPQPVVLCTGTLSVWDGLNDEIVHDGLMGRILVFQDDAKPQRNDYQNKAIPQSTIDWTTNWHNHHSTELGKVIPHPTEISMSQAGKRILSEYRDWMDQQMDLVPDFAPIIGRSDELVCRVSLDCAIADYLPTADRPNLEGMEITAEHVEWAIRLVQWSTAKKIYEIGRNMSKTPYHAHLQRIKKIILDAKGWISRSEITRKTQDIPSDIRNKIYETLLEGELVASDLRKPSSGGSEKLCFCAI